MGELQTKLNELGLDRIIDSGVTIAAVLQKIIKWDNFTNLNVDSLDYSKVIKKEFCLSLRELVYNKMLDIYKKQKSGGYGSNIKDIDDYRSVDTNTNEKAKSNYLFNVFIR